MTLLSFDERFLGHATGKHPECPQRLEFLHAHLKSTDLPERCVRPDVNAAKTEQIQMVHAPKYVSHLARFAASGGGWLDSDTFVSPRSFDVARLAVGSVIQAVDAVMQGPEHNALCLVRPPGHHALPGMAMGFCLFNNIAIAAVHAREHYRLHRILIADWDVHHGNGTQCIFYRDHGVYYVSVHRWPFFPGTGAVSETGEGDGLGTTFNLPLEFGVSRKELLDRFNELLNVAASRCCPELVLLSAGFDAHHADPIGSLGLETEDYGPLTKMVQNVANKYCDGRLVSVLEGGYNIPVLAECVDLHLRSLLD